MFWIFEKTTIIKTSGCASTTICIGKVENVQLENVSFENYWNENKSGFWCVWIGGGALPEWALVENANPSSDLENVSQGCHKFVQQLETNSVHISQNPSSMLSMDPICFATNGFGVGSATLGYQFSLCTLELDSDFVANVTNLCNTCRQNQLLFFKILLV